MRGGDAGLPAPWADRFFVALSGTPRLTGTEDRYGKGVYALPYGLRERRMLDVPKYLMQYRGDGYQSVVGLGCGPDAIYVVPIFPDRTGVTAILAVTYDSTAVYPYGLAEHIKPIRLMEDKGCFGCQRWLGRVERLGPRSIGTRSLPWLTARLSKGVPASIDSVDALPVEPFVSSRRARHDVLDVKGMDRVQLWMRHHILQPKFDNPRSQMPALDLSDAQAVALTEFLLAEPPTAALEKRRGGRRRLALVFAVGLVVGVTGSGAVAGGGGGPRANPAPRIGTGGEVGAGRSTSDVAGAPGAAARAGARWRAHQSSRRSASRTFRSSLPSRPR